MTEISKQPYKGVRDFYPDQQRIRRWMFGTLRTVVETYGYEEYDASVLEPAELYRAKSSEEIVNEQTYTFTDRGNREVTLRPEMTPTIARMIASRHRDIPFPARWYSIPNLFRYERPQRGRLREHWQLNVDLFGSKSSAADAEVIQMASDILQTFGLKQDNFEIRLSSRVLTDLLFRGALGLDDAQTQRITRLLDKKGKIPDDELRAQIELLIDTETDHLFSLLDSKTPEDFRAGLPEAYKSDPVFDEFSSLLHMLSDLGIENIQFDLSLMRGFDYYTGIIFEVFDTSSENNRSLFGGGRYDNLLEIFGEEKVPAVGFGMGDVALLDVLETYNLVPKLAPQVEIILCTLDTKVHSYALQLAQELRNQNVSVAVDFTGRKVGTQIKDADKHGVPFVICIGDNEIKTERFSVKNLASGKEEDVVRTDLARYIRESH